MPVRGGGIFVVDRDSQCLRDWRNLWQTTDSSRDQLTLAFAFFLRSQMLRFDRWPDAQLLPGSIRKSQWHRWPAGGARG